VVGLAALAGGARDQNDPSAPLQATRGGTRRVEHGVSVLCHRSSPLLVRHILQRDILSRPDPRVSDKDVEAIELPLGAFEQRRSAGERREVRRVRERAHAQPGEPLHDVRSLGLPRAIADPDIRTTLGEQEGRRGTDSSRASGHERALAAQRDHVVSSVSMISQIACSMQR
jgi:hypothetical protein